ncbi:ABC transporter ATP-binding protein [Pararhizobium sp. LjRoot255]|uniref:ABC transporter ATP-binding protein n=1 Tax=Pararhizobium sp. LjRoot255 TaxID=3342298 RepID=UPI003ED0DB99
MIGQQMTLRRVQKTYGAVWAVRETDLEIGKGEFVSIVGPSGSGKTTLLTMIAGFETPTAGSIMVGGQDVTMLAPNRRNIGMVFQKYALFPHMTVRQNIEFPLRMRRLAKGRGLAERVDAMLDLVQLGALQHRYPHQLSGGQQQRVAVARALVFDPPVILMDEPLGALDKKLREAMQFEIKRLQERIGATVIYVTHDQEEALTMSDRVAVMHKGRLEQIGTPNNLYANPDNAFVADFVGSVNFIPGTVCGTDHLHVAIKVGNALVQVRTPQGRQAYRYEEGAAVRVAARPEHIAIAPYRDRDALSLSGTIETMVFAGASRTALVRLHEVPELVLRADVPSSISSLPDRGSNVALSFSVDALRIFDAEGTA